jgi:hypothetical protein
MTEKRYDKMITLLIGVTKSDKLKWNSDEEHGSFYTGINGCRIEIKSYYDHSLDDSIATLLLSNVNGQQFASYTYSSMSDEDEYKALVELEEAVRDKYYKITESERLIIEGLEQLAIE